MAEVINSKKTCHFINQTKKERKKARVFTTLSWKRFNRTTIVMKLKSLIIRLLAFSPLEI